MAHPTDPIDLRQPPAREERIEISPYSSEWAKIVNPVTVALLSLIAAVMLLAFGLVVSVGNSQTGDRALTGQSPFSRQWSDWGGLSSATPLGRVATRRIRPLKNKRIFPLLVV